LSNNTFYAASGKGREFGSTWGFNQQLFDLGMNHSNFGDEERVGQMIEKIDADFDLVNIFNTSLKSVQKMKFTYSHRSKQCQRVGGSPISRRKGGGALSRPKINIFLRKVV
jgi:hypothetical protein